MASDDSKPAPKKPAPAEVETVIDGERKRLTYEQAFRLGCVLLGAGKWQDAARLFKCMEEFTDRGPRAFIMEAFCQAAAMRFDSCSESLAEGFQDNDAIATKLQNAFISFHVGIREEGINSLIELVNERNDLPTVCFLLGEMLMKVDRPDMVKKCWALAIERDRKAGRGGCRCSSADQKAIGDFSRRARAAESGEPLNGNILSSQQHFVAPRQIVR